MTKCKALTGSAVKGLNAHLLRVHCIAFLYELFILLSMNDLSISGECVDDKFGIVRVAVSSLAFSPFYRMRHQCIFSRPVSV